MARRQRVVAARVIDLISALHGHGPLPGIEHILYGVLRRHAELLPAAEVVGYPLQDLRRGRLHGRACARTAVESIPDSTSTPSPNQAAAILVSCESSGFAL
jgi:hypothetical protein